MPKDNVRDVDRGKFERAFIETQTAMVRRLQNEQLPNEVIETIIGRLVAFRAAVTQEPLAEVAARVYDMAIDYEKSARQGIAIARLIVEMDCITTTGAKP